MQKPPPVYSIDHVFRPEQDAAYVHFENAAANGFQPDPDGFPRVNAWWLADSALATYWDETRAKSIFQRAGLDSTFVKVDSTDCYIAWQDTFAIVAFRGTEPDEWGDVLTDAMIALVPWQAGKVHLGFKKAIDTIWPRLELEPNALAAGRTIWFCGHSLGAALATLAADRYAKTRGVCTFGCPRVGDRAFATAFGAKLAGRSLRYVNHNDIVTHVPPPLFGYKHVGEGRFIARDGTIAPNPPVLAHFFAELFGRPETLLENIDGLRGGTLKTAPNSLTDHMPKAYAIWTWNDHDANG
jgi:triacylglycerol lipase